MAHLSADSRSESTPILAQIKTGRNLKTVSERISRIFAHRAGNLIEAGADFPGSGSPKSGPRCSSSISRRTEEELAFRRGGTGPDCGCLLFGTGSLRPGTQRSAASHLQRLQHSGGHTEPDICGLHGRISRFRSVFLLQLHRRKRGSKLHP